MRRSGQTWKAVRAPRSTQAPCSGLRLWRIVMASNLSCLPGTSSPPSFKVMSCPAHLCRMCRVLHSRRRSSAAGAVVCASIYQGSRSWLWCPWAIPAAGKGRHPTAISSLRPIVVCQTTYCSCSMSSSCRRAMQHHQSRSSCRGTRSRAS